jgi:hypothetical protein
MTMDTIDKLLNCPEPVSSNHLTGPVFDSIPLLERDVWQESFNQLDAFAESDANPDLPLEQQQYLRDLSVDRFLHATLEREFALLETWLRKNRRHPEAETVAGFLQRKEKLGPLTWIEQQEILYVWALRNEREELGTSILGWRLLCDELAETLLAWASESGGDSRKQMIGFWQDSHGFYPQNRLRIWALRFLEDARAPQVLIWEMGVYQVLQETRPGLLIGPR